MIRMSNKLTLHIGTHKTGTSSLQSYFSLLRQDSKSLGINYPSIPACFRTKYPGKQHKFLAQEIHNDESKIILTDWLSDLRHQDEDNIISSETFWRINPPEVTRTNSPNCQLFLSLNEKSIAILKNFLVDFDVKIHVFLRRQDLLIASLHRGSIMRGKKVKELELDPDTYILLYPDILKNWVKYFGRESVFIHLYDESISGNKGIASMTKKMGLSNIYDNIVPSSDIIKHKWELSLEEVELFRICKKFLINSCDFSIFRDKFFPELLSSTLNNARKAEIDQCLGENIKIVNIDPSWYSVQNARNNQLLSHFEIDKKSSDLKVSFLEKHSDVKIAEVADDSAISELARTLIIDFQEWNSSRSCRD